MFKTVGWIAPLVALGLLFACVQTSVVAQTTGTVTGKVTEGTTIGSAVAIADAKVTLWTQASGASKAKQVAESTTDAAGVYTLSDVAAGKYTLKVNAGMKAGQATVSVKAGETATADVKVSVAKTNSGK